jgi:general secretion pathway protein A
LLELLRQLLNFETNTEKLLQVVLFGQNELRDRLDRKPNLKSRVAMWGALSTLTREEAKAMLRFRFKVAGGEGFPFTPEAFDAVYKYTLGVPRTACIMCDNALLKGFLRRERTVSLATVDAVYQEMDIHLPIEETTKVGRPKKALREVAHG